MIPERNEGNDRGQPPIKGNWYLLTGLVIGILLGLAISWVLAPVKYVDTLPNSLRSDFKDEFRILIASAFSANNNLPRAEARLNLLGDPDPVQALILQAQDLVASGDPTGSAFTLAFLSDALMQSLRPTITSSPSPTPKEEDTSTLELRTQAPPKITSTIKPTSTLTRTPLPSLTPSPTVGNQYKLISSDEICTPNQDQLVLQVEINDSAGKPVPGIELLITWLDGESHFFTGLKPELGNGYADYQMTPEIIYSLQISQSNAVVNNITAPSCNNGSGMPFWGGYKLIFQRP